LVRSQVPFRHASEDLILDERFMFGRYCEKEKVLHAAIRHTDFYRAERHLEWHRTEGCGEGYGECVKAWVTFLHMGEEAFLSVAPCSKQHLLGISECTCDTEMRKVVMLRIRALDLRR